jgi:ubiquinone/menaquinone biosynthesis C-methylase UbiE
MDYDKSEIATIYDEARSLTPERLRQWRDVLATHLDSRAISVVVDLGCGTGRFTELLATHFSARVIGIDPSQRMIDRARQKPIAGNVAFRRAEAEALPIEDGSVELVFLSQVYHHLTDPAAVGRECWRVLRRGGQVGIRNTTREDDFIYRHFFPLQPLIDSELPARRDIEAVFAAAGFASTVRQTIPQLVSADWPSFVRATALRGDSFLARLADEEFEAGMVALRAHADKIDRDPGVTEEIDWFVFTKEV